MRKLSASTSGFDDASFRANFEPVRDRIKQAIARGNATGVAVAVVQGGRIVWEEGFGWANREAGLKVTPNTPFSMASITKPFTTTTLMTLVAEGKVSLDESANNILLKSKILGANGNPAAATVRMLGAHISGLPSMYESYVADEAKLVLSADDLLKAYGRLAYPPGMVYEYSNIGYAALNAIASILTETDFGELMRQKVLAPVGLKNSFFRSNTNRLQDEAVPYDSSGQRIPAYTTSTPASGELYSSAHDLALFVLFNMPRPIGKSHILSGQNIAELHRPVFTGPSGVASTFGWFKGHTPSGNPFFFKTGGNPGVANRICFSPPKNLGCVVVTNQSKAAGLAYSVCDEIMKAYLPDWQRPEEYCGFPSAAFVPNPQFVGSWQGSLENGGASMPISLTIASSEVATLAIGTNKAKAITEMRTEGKAFVGLSNGLVDSLDVERTGAHTLQIQLFYHDDRLIGRVLATAGDPSIHNVSLPYVLGLTRK